MGGFRTLKLLLSFCFNMIAMNDSSPEKAGGGGPIPSLATTLNIS
jgi:hypothetical protein